MIFVKAYARCGMVGILRHRLAAAAATAAAADVFSGADLGGRVYERPPRKSLPPGLLRKALRNDLRAGGHGCRAHHWCLHPCLHPEPLHITYVSLLGENSSAALKIHIQIEI
jgi:hypothetical protein